MFDKLEIEKKWHRINKSAQCRRLSMSRLSGERNSKIIFFVGAKNGANVSF